MNRTSLGALISEAVAMAIIIAIGDSVAAMYTLYDPSPYQQAYWGVCIAWGLAVTIAIYATASVSGCHANPAVTLALAIYRGFSWSKVLPYFAAQTVGAFCGAVFVYALYTPVINLFNATHHLTRAAGGAAGVFFTHPGLAITPTHAFTDEILLTAVLIFGIFAITEQYNELAPGANSGALIIGFLVAAIGASMGYLEAWAINPARLRPAPLLLPRRLGSLRASLAAELLVGAHRRSSARWRPRRSGIPVAHPSISARPRPRQPAALTRTRCLRRCRDAPSPTGTAHRTAPRLTTPAPRP